jgi:TonB family protein
MFSRTGAATIRTTHNVNRSVKLSLKALFFALILGHGLMAFCDTEFELKANFIYTFAKSTDLPNEKLGDASAPYVIGVFGGDADFVDALRDATAGKAVATHQIKVKHLSSESELAHCNLVYFRGATRKRAADAIRDIPSGIVLVGEDQQFLADGGMINLVAEHGKLHFEVSKAALDKGNVRLDQRLLALAKGATESTGFRKVRVNVTPEYPDIARRMAIKGIVQLKVKVSAEGAVKGVDVVGGNPVLVEAAVKAVKQWRYDSASKDTVELAKFTFD